MMKANLAAKLLARLSKLNLQGVCINSCEPNGLLIVDKDVKFTISKQSSLSPPRFGTKREVRFQPRISATKCDACVHELRVLAPKREVRVQPQAVPKRENARPTFSLRLRQDMTLEFHFKMRESLTVLKDDLHVFIQKCKTHVQQEAASE